MNERYRGGQDIIIDLPAEYDINHIDWLSVYCYKFRVDFGHVSIINVSQRIPPYVPPQKRVSHLEDIRMVTTPVHRFTLKLANKLRDFVIVCLRHSKKQDEFLK